MSLIDFASSSGNEPSDEVSASLRANRIDPKFLYTTPRQAELWRQVFLKHSPIHTNPEFGRIYRNAFAKVAGQFAGRPVHLIGLGPGTGVKEFDLLQHLRRQGCTVTFSVVDISRELVEESSGRLVGGGAKPGRSLIGDLAADDLSRWLKTLDQEGPRLITFFGLCPNFLPAAVAKIFRATLRPGDLLLASAHLVPSEGDSTKELEKGMHKILSQYDNAETKAWLSEAVNVLGLTAQLMPPLIQVDIQAGVPAVLGIALWKHTQNVTVAGQTLPVKAGSALRLFFSLRYTPLLFERRMRQENFLPQRLELTTCAEEGIWAVSLP